MIAFINNMFLAAAENGDVIVKATKADGSLSGAAIGMLIFGSLMLYGGLAVCLYIAVKKGKPIEE